MRALRIKGLAVFITPCDVMKANIIDMSKNTMMIQICDTPDRTKLLLTMLQSISIAEVARTGTLALAKCSENDD